MKKITEHIKEETPQFGPSYRTNKSVDNFESMTQTMTINSSCYMREEAPEAISEMIAREKRDAIKHRRGCKCCQCFNVIKKKKVSFVGIGFPPLLC